MGNRLTTQVRPQCNTSLLPVDKIVCNRVCVCRQVWVQEAKTPCIRASPSINLTAQVSFPFVRLHSALPLFPPYSPRYILFSLTSTFCHSSHPFSSLTFFCLTPFSSWFTSSFSSLVPPYYFPFPRLIYLLPNCFLNLTFSSLNSVVSSIHTSHMHLFFLYGSYFSL